VGTWIEISSHIRFFNAVMTVVPYVGTWIEISPLSNSN